MKLKYFLYTICCVFLCASCEVGNGEVWVSGKEFHVGRDGGSVAVRSGGCMYCIFRQVDAAGYRIDQGAEDIKVPMDAPVVEYSGEWFEMTAITDAVTPRYWNLVITLKPNTDMGMRYLSVVFDDMDAHSGIRISQD